MKKSECDFFSCSNPDDDSQHVKIFVSGSMTLLELYQQLKSGGEQLQQAYQCFNSWVELAEVSFEVMALNLVLANTIQRGPQKLDCFLVKVISVDR